MGILGQVVLRHLHLVERIAVDVFLRRLARVVRRVEGDVHEERIVAFFGILEKTKRIVGDHLAPVLATLPEPFEALVPGLPRIGLALVRAVVALAGLVRHSAAYVTGDVEGLLGLRPNVPLPGHVGAIARLLEMLGPETPGLALLLAGPVDLVGLPDETPGVDHRPAGDADRAAPGAHIVGVGEARPRADDAVEVRRLDLIIAEGVDGVVALVVGEDEEKIGFRGRLGESR